MIDQLEKAIEYLNKRHINVHDTCPVSIGGERGWLGYSSGLYTRVWFDTEEKSRTLYWSFDKQSCEEKYNSLKSQYGI